MRLDFGVRKNVSELVEPVTDVIWVEFFPLPINNPFDVEDILGTACDSLVDNEVFWRTDEDSFSRFQFIVSGAVEHFIFVAGEGKRNIYINTIAGRY